MSRSPVDLKPVSTGRYRYSKWRWRVLVRALDAAGGLAAPIWRRLRPPQFVASPRRILIVQLDHLGDAVLTAPLIAQLRAAYPEATIDVLASPSNHEVFESNRDVDRVRIADRTWFERSPGRRGLLREVWRLGRSLRGEGYDLGIDVRGDVLSILVLALGGVTRRVGFAMGGGAFLLTDVAEWTAGRHEVRSRLALLEALGVKSDPSVRAAVHIQDEDRMFIAARLLEAWPLRTSPARRHEAPVHSTAGRELDEWRGAWSTTVPAKTSLDDSADWLHAERFSPQPPLLAVHLGAGTAAKRWPKSHWKTLIDRFLKDGWRIVIVGGPEDPPLSRMLTPHERLVDWSGRLSVTRTTALLERADLFIGADSGPAHLAASTGVVSVILFSGTNNPLQWRPWSKNALVLRKRVSCSPCHQKTCPLAEHLCMAGLDPDRVYRAAQRWWTRTQQTQSPYTPF
jgi:ADP-heptose:LPS heptosyltransferase